MKIITINYLSHLRENYHELIFYFLKKIKQKNKDKIKLNILSSTEKNWAELCKDLGIEFEIKNFFNYSTGYLEKIQYASESESPYSVKLDEDCFFNNHIWDFIIENVGILEDEKILCLSTTMSNSIPSCDLFIEDFILKDEIKKIIYENFKNRLMPNGLWGVDYTPLNKHTINSSCWNPDEFYKGVEQLSTEIKGIHPLRICYESQKLINQEILKNVDFLVSPQEYKFQEIISPYFTNIFFVIKTSNWKKILKNSIQYDEISLNNFKKNNNLKIMYIKNGFCVHLNFNTIFGNKNPWGIGGENAQFEETILYNQLKNKIFEL